MSAFVVDGDHIDLLVTAIRTFRARAVMDDPSHVGGCTIHRGELTDPDELGRTLLTANVAAVLTRYQDTDQHERDGYSAAIQSYRYRSVPLDGALGAHPAVAVLKAEHCYTYQASEDEHWPDSEARAWMTGLTEAASRALPGYSEAATWQFQRHPLTHAETSSTSAA